MAAIDQNKIRKTAQFVRGFAIFIMLALPLMMVWYWLDPFNTTIEYLTVTFNSDNRLVGALITDGYITRESLTLELKILGFFISALPLAAFLFSIFQGYRLMGHFGEGRYITSETIKALKLASMALLLFAPLSILSEPLLALALTLGNPPGQRLFSFGIGSTEIIALFLGGFLLMITRTFNIEKERAEEHASIV